MKAFGHAAPAPIDAAEALLAFDAPEPLPSAQDLLVEIRAVSVNPVDVKVRANMAPTGEGPRILGWDAAGVVIGKGAAVEGFEIGDAVYYAGDLTRPGANAERQAVDARIVGKKPNSLSFEEAAALPLTAITAWEMLFDRLGYRPGAEGPGRSGADETLAIIGAAGGVGSIAVQLARTLTELTVIGTASRAETSAWLTELGAHHVVDHSRPLAPQLTALAPGGVDAVFAVNGTDQHLDALVEALKPQGAFGLVDDPTAFDIAKLKLKSIALHWEFMFTRSMFGTDDIAAQGALLNQVAALIEAGRLRTTMTEVFGPLDLESLLRAHRHIETGRTRGKIVLTAA